jgi:hypothetical protein
MLDPNTTQASCHFAGFCALKPADQAAWAGAIASFLAAVVALGIALSGGIVKRWQRQKDGRALAAYIATELFTVYNGLGKSITYIEKFDDPGDGLMKENLFGFAASTDGYLLAPILHAKVDQFGLLPSDIGEELAGAVGSFTACMQAVDKFAAEIRTTEPPKWNDFCRPILEQLRQTKDNMDRAVKYCRKVGGDL